MSHKEWLQSQELHNKYAKLETDIKQLLTQYRVEWLEDAMSNDGEMANSIIIHTNEDEDNHETWEIYDQQDAIDSPKTGWRAMHCIDGDWDEVEHIASSLIEVLRLVNLV